LSDPGIEELLDRRRRGRPRQGRHHLQGVDPHRRRRSHSPSSESRPLQAQPLDAHAPAGSISSAIVRAASVASPAR
jgi:hypothetical protein